ncbi:TCR/Tet family MFS transporter [Pacificimonas sp. WHA3]|uniref:TCR/Tet family MFS transporter n=1 Tax=Pacificimonas pallii TaxID=2827236 RepID=A0ABS6SGS3_9SPHN|nr:TCR/Tet family MFS transporter [Pacificimonas pallii]MBV7257238.1 TCR/Tet family MFS transporter [Pacificimonas pallii]
MAAIPHPSDPSAQKGMRGSLAFVFAVVLIDMIGFGIIMPVLPSLLTELTGDSNAAAAMDAGWLAFVYAAMQFVFGPIVGNLSDRYGRRPVLLATLLAYSVNYALMGLAPTLLWLFIGRIIAGITGASFSAAYAYVADITPPEKRAENFGLIGLAFGLGFIVGPALGGVLGDYSLRLPFYAAGALALVNFVFGYFCLRESLPRDRRRPFSLIRSNAVSALKELNGQDRVIIWYAAALLFWMTAHMVYPIIWAFYGIEAFGWSKSMIGLSLAGVGLSSAIVQGGLIRLIVPRIGERRSIILGVTCMFTGCMIYLLAGNEIWVPVAIAVGSLQGLVQPSINALMSRAVSERSQGELQGAVASISSLSSMFSPLMFTAVFFFFTNEAAVIYAPGAVFGLAAMIAIVSLAVFLHGNGLHGMARTPGPLKP